MVLPLTKDPATSLLASVCDLLALHDRLRLRLVCSVCHSGCDPIKGPSMASFAKGREEDFSHQLRRRYGCVARVLSEAFFIIGSTDC